MVRFPDGMRDRLREAAEANKRSMNAEIVARLEASFADLPPAPVRSILEAPEDWGALLKDLTLQLNEVVDNSVDASIRKHLSELLDETKPSKKTD